MVNIWEYKSGEEIIAITKEGKKYQGRVAAIWDIEETEEDEDCIDIQVSEDFIVGLHPSEIATIIKP